jgi:uncharacterized membrane protein
MLGRRVQSLLDDDRYRKVANEAQRRGVALAAVVKLEAWSAASLLPAASTPCSFMA